MFFIEPSRLGFDSGGKIESNPVSYKIFKPQSPALALFPAQNSREVASSKSDGLEVELEARNVYVYDLLQKKILFEKNAIESRPLASLTKLMTALVLEEHLPRGIFIPVSSEAVHQEGDDGFLVGDRFQKEDLINFMLVSSSNDAAYAATEFVGVSNFVSLMNEKAKALGLETTFFLNPHGLDIEREEGIISAAYGRAVEMAHLMEFIFVNYPQLLDKTREDEIIIFSENGRNLRARNTNKALGSIPQLIGAKTGFTELAGGNLVFIFDAGFSHPVVVSLLGSSEEGRFSDAKKIIDAVLKYYQTL
jgi:D-alanyl-D-alanine carboxypeptidase (penicillin-binding protein 5/6)